MAGQYLVGYSRGDYGNFGDLPQKMATYAEEQALCLEGPVYVEYLLNEIYIKEPEKLLSRISVCVTKEGKHNAPCRTSG
jgi:effector-binding domain-containing protein